MNPHLCLGWNYTADECTMLKIVIRDLRGCYFWVSTAHQLLPVHSLIAFAISYLLSHDLMQFRWKYFWATSQVSNVNILLCNITFYYVISNQNAHYGAISFSCRLSFNPLCWWKHRCDSNGCQEAVKQVHLEVAIKPPTTSLVHWWIKPVHGLQQHIRR